MRILGNYLKSSTNSVEEQLKLKEKDGMKRLHPLFGLFVRQCITKYRTSVGLLLPFYDGV